MTMITNEAGTEIEFEAAVELMDDDAREAVHALALADEAAFFRAYCAEHRERFGAEFEPNKANPVW